jgi:hypothetical protein
MFKTTSRVFLNYRDCLPELGERLLNPIFTNNLYRILRIQSITEIHEVMEIVESDKLFDKIYLMSNRSYNWTFYEKENLDGIYRVITDQLNYMLDPDFPIGTYYAIAVIRGSDTLRNNPVDLHAYLNILLFKFEVKEIQRNFILRLFLKDKRCVSVTLQSMFLHLRRDLQEQIYSGENLKI